MPFAQPAGHFVFGRGQGDDVAELVPERGLPVVFSVGEAAGAVHGDDGAKANSQQSGTAQAAKRTNGKVGLVRKELDQDRVFQFEAVFFTENLLGFGQQTERAISVEGGFVCRHSDGEVGRLDGVEALDLFAQGFEIEGESVVFVGFAYFLGERPRFFFFAETEVIAGQSQFGGEKIRIEFDGAKL